jgi:Protein of unknown function (DUF2842)
MRARNTDAPWRGRPGCANRRRVSRILPATLVGLAGFTAYLVAAVTLFDRVASAHWAVQALYFVVAGTLWVIPARWLMLWAAHKL